MREKKEKNSVTACVLLTAGKKAFERPQVSFCLTNSWVLSFFFLQIIAKKKMNMPKIVTQPKELFFNRDMYFDEYIVYLLEGFWVL